MLGQLWLCHLVLIVNLVYRTSAVQQTISKREILAPRQLTKHELIRRLDKKAERIAALRKTPKRTETGLTPRASVAPYETCAATDVGGGWAVYSGAAPATIALISKITVSNKAQCSLACVNSAAGCKGYAYHISDQLNCAFDAGVSINTGLVAAIGWDTYVPGSCASNDIKKECCDSKPYPVCSSIGIGPGFASFLNYYSPGNGILTPVITLLGGLLGSITRMLTRVESPSELECSRKCAGQSACVGFSYSSGWCEIKQNTATVVSNLQPEGSWSTYVKGTCARFAASTNALCCDSS